MIFQSFSLLKPSHSKIDCKPPFISECNIHISKSIQQLMDRKKSQTYKTFLFKKKNITLAHHNMQEKICCRYFCFIVTDIICHLSLFLLLQGIWFH